MAGGKARASHLMEDQDPPFILMVDCGEGGGTGGEGKRKDVMVWSCMEL